MPKNLQNTTFEIWGRSVTFSSSGKTGSPVPPGYYSVYRNVYFELYRIYDDLNFHCWHGRLPRVVLALDRSDIPTRTIASGFSFACRTDQRTMHLIKFNLIQCVKLSKKQFLTVFLHEMIHIEQFFTNRTPGHEADFYRRGLNVGFDEKNELLQPGSSFVSAIAEIEKRGFPMMKHLQLIWEDRESKQNCTPRPSCQEKAERFIYPAGEYHPAVDADFQFYLNHRGRIDF
ncbi:MAG: hypothetical protein PHT84_05275 [Candidatus Pacebacteria bacterium]|nr:hypothetical protein [Candidatus Paceibacterota bacterium]